jgi:Holliday junction resolvase RusA-like endonuclease
MSGPDAIEFEVKGLPPKKSEAKSLFAVDHTKDDRVTALLKAVHDAMQCDDWNTVTGWVALELTIYCPDRPDGDATNFLGGVADVLQGKAPLNVDVTHLQDLAVIGLYADDKQINQILYQELPASEVRYRIRVSKLQ